VSGADEDFFLDPSERRSKVGVETTFFNYYEKEK